MVNESVRIGLIGAGKNTRDRHIPGFQSVQDVEIAAVANRSMQSGRQVADQFNIPQVYGNWQELLEDDSLDAVCIGTWPYMHRTLTLAALESGKHVLCEARMATNAAEAQDMLDASREKPELVAQIVPSPMTFRVDDLIKKQINGGYLGDLLSVEIQVLGPDFVEIGGPLHWRHNRDLSGYNILSLGIWYEAMIRWAGRATKVMAMTKVNASYRIDDNGDRVGITIPDHVDVLCELANGAQAHIRVSATTGLSPGNDIWLYGSEGTLHLDGKLNLSGGRRGDNQMSEIANPPEEQYAWRVEQEFIGAIRGEETIVHTPFDVGVHYMEFTEAVTRSAQSGQAISLPL